MNQERKADIVRKILFARYCDREWCGNINNSQMLQRTVLNRAQRIQNIKIKPIHLIL